MELVVGAYNQVSSRDCGNGCLCIAILFWGRRRGFCSGGWRWHVLQEACKHLTEENKNQSYDIKGIVNIPFLRMLLKNYKNEIFHPKLYSSRIYERNNIPAISGDLHPYTLRRHQHHEQKSGKFQVWSRGTNFHTWMRRSLSSWTVCGDMVTVDVQWMSVEVRWTRMRPRCEPALSSSRQNTRKPVCMSLVVILAFTSLKSSKSSSHDRTVSLIH